MGWYVFALVDAIPAGRAGKGLTGALSLRKLPAGFVVVERRADVPPVEFGSLKKHQDVVTRLAGQVPAILPVRFGTLLETGHLEEALQERDEEILEAFDLVRGRVQFTWRIKRRSGVGDRGSGIGDRGAGAGDRGSGVGAKAGTQLKSGTEYLRNAARAANPAPPASFRPLRTTLSALITGQRYQPATPAIPEAVYHLVEQKNVDRYVAAAGALKETSPQFTVSGPFPPFAFAPEIL
jgi:hypothetical protein